jgi:hypothetical protein
VENQELPFKLLLVKNGFLLVGLSQNLYDQSVFVGLKAAKTTREFYQINEK